MTKIPMPLTRQTSKEVKRAYRKRSNANALPSAEQRRLERAAELDRRAQVLREREANRKAAAQKRAEKEAAEREKRKRMGIPEPLPKIRSSQRRLGDFLVPKRKGVEEEEEEEEEEEKQQQDREDEDDDNAGEGASAAICINEEPPQASKEEATLLPNAHLSRSQGFNLPARLSQSGGRQEAGPSSQVKYVSPPRAKAIDRILSHKEELFTEPEDLANMFPSNSQIQRDLNFSSSPTLGHDLAPALAPAPPSLIPSPTFAISPRKHTTLTRSQQQQQEADTPTKAGKEKVQLPPPPLPAIPAASATASRSFSELLQGISTQELEYIDSSPPAQDARGQDEKARAESVVAELADVLKHNAAAFPELEMEDADSDPDPEPKKKKTTAAAGEDSSGHAGQVEVPGVGWMRMEDLDIPDDEMEELMS